MSFTLRPYQEAGASAGVDFLRDDSQEGGGLIVAPTGCHAAGTKILMADGTTERVEDIPVGDLVMGPDYEHRTVLQLHTGADVMYAVHARYNKSKLFPFVVNAGHILHLLDWSIGETENIAMSEFARFSKHKQERYRLVRRISPTVTTYPQFSIERLEPSTYHGFTLDGDQLYLTKDRVVHHNSGKSLYIAAIASRLNEPTLIFQPSKEILQQNFQKMVSFGYRPEVFSASAGRKRIAPITFATIGTAVKRPELFRDFRHVIIDECHLASIQSQKADSDTMYKRFLDEMHQPRVLGLTATPYRLYGSRLGSELRFLTRIKGGLFRHMVHYTQVKELFDSGYLSKLEYFRHKGIDLTKLQFNSTGTDYTDESVRLAMQAGGLEGKVVNMCMRLLAHGRRGIIVFVRFIDQARLIAETIPGAAYVTGETPRRERDAIFTGFRSAKIKVLVNVGVAEIGFDYPELDTVILASPTASLAKYYQRVGRVLRPHPSKTSAYVVDMAGLVDRFGEIENLHIHEQNGKHRIYTIDKRRNVPKPLTNVLLDKFGNAFTPRPKPNKYALPERASSW